MDKQIQNENTKQYKRLKSLDEPTSKKIANQEQVNAIIDELYKKSKTHEHNKNVLNKQIPTIKNKKEPIFIRMLKTLSKICVFCLKCIFFFIIGFLLLTIIYLITVAIN